MYCLHSSRGMKVQIQGVGWLKSTPGLPPGLEGPLSPVSVYITCPTDTLVSSFPHLLRTPIIWIRSTLINSLYHLHIGSPSELLEVRTLACGLEGDRIWPIVFRKAPPPNQQNLTTSSVLKRILCTRVSWKGHKWCQKLMLGWRGDLGCCAFRLVTWVTCSIIEKET